MDDEFLLSGDRAMVLVARMSGGNVSGKGLRQIIDAPLFLDKTELENLGEHMDPGMVSIIMTEWGDAFGSASTIVLLYLINPAGRVVRFDGCWVGDRACGTVCKGSIGPRWNDTLRKSLDTGLTGTGEPNDLGVWGYFWGFGEPDTSSSNPQPKHQGYVSVNNYSIVWGENQKKRALHFIDKADVSKHRTPVDTWVCRSGRQLK